MSQPSPFSLDMPMHVLVVDDDRDMLELLEATIRECLGSEVQLKTLAHPREALAWMDANLVDVLVTDLVMPELSGLEVLRHAKRRNAWTQVIMITGQSERDTLTEAMDLGAHDYLVKPLDLDDLEAVLGEVSARLHRWRRSLARTLSQYCLLL